MAEETIEVKIEGNDWWEIAREVLAGWVKETKEQIELLKFAQSNDATLFLAIQSRLEALEQSNASNSLSEEIANLVGARFDQLEERTKKGEGRLEALEAVNPRRVAAAPKDSGVAFCKQVRLQGQVLGRTVGGMALDLELTPFQGANVRVTIERID
jgi:hypothetical protein